MKKIPICQDMALTYSMKILHRIYNEMEQMGVVLQNSGQGTFVTEDSDVISLSMFYVKKYLMIYLMNL